ncbi:flagellar assembly protein FliW [Lysinibacillus telephonicus]|uniref:flagellar assembly protein FliW n=1 Tax=Lysinibacillus telephonicus TaxID=1714840 RepID=UPI0031FD92B5
MLIATKFLGDIEIQEQQIITFEQGLLGLGDIKKFVLLPLEKESPFVILQSTEQQEIGFVVAYPFAFKEDYVFEISEEDKKDLRVEKEEELITYSIVTLKEPFETSTLNLLAPIVINTAKRYGKQVVLPDNKIYPLRYQITAVEGSAK